MNIQEAYARFQTELHKITQDHRTTVTSILAQIDQKRIEELEEKIHASL